MSTYEYMMGIGSNGDGIELGPGVPVGPDAPPPGAEFIQPPVDEMDSFIAKLKNEQGPFVFIDDKTPEGKKFVSWIALYEPSFFEWFMKLAMVKMAAAGAAVSEIPEWVTGQTIRIRKSLWDTYQQCTIRVQDLLAKQGKVLSSTLNPTEAQSFLEWWKIHDPAGVISLIVMFSPDTVPEPDKMPEMQFPKKLYDFWKVTKGSVEPPKPLLGMENSWSDWFFDNWLWLAGGAAGGVVAARWYMGRKDKNRSTVIDPISRNPRHGMGSYSRKKRKNMHGCVVHTNPTRKTGGNQTVRLPNSKTVELIEHSSGIWRVVSSDNQSLGWLYMETEEGGFGHVTPKWRVRNRHGLENVGRSRKDLLSWLIANEKTPGRGPRRGLVPRILGDRWPY